MTVFAFRPTDIAELPARSRDAGKPRGAIAAIEGVAETVAGGIVAVGPAFWAVLLCAFIAAECGLIS